MRDTVLGGALLEGGTAGLGARVASTALGGLGDVARGVAAGEAQAGHGGETVGLGLGGDNSGHGGDGGDGGEVHLEDIWIVVVSWRRKERE